MRNFITAVPLLLAIIANPALAAVGDTTARDPVMPPANGKPGSDKPQPPTASRGQLLYENHCQACHASQLHIRADRRARSIDELRGWVSRWAAVQKLNWGNEEIGAVTDYLNQRYYRLAPPVRKN